MTKKENKQGNGGKALASCKGYMALLSQRSHGQISKREFASRKKSLLAKLHRNA